MKLGILGMGLCALIVVGSSAVMAAPQIVTCNVAPVSPQKGQYALNYHLTVEEDGAARIEGLRSKDVRVRQSNGKIRTDRNWSPFRFSSVTTDATGATNVNAKAHGYVGSLRWRAPANRSSQRPDRRHKGGFATVALDILP